MEILTKPPVEQSVDQNLHKPNSLNKLEFEGIDPRFSDVVYHFTPEENLPGIATEGLRFSDRDVYGEKWIKAEDLLMDAKPADIAVDLSHTVFAQLEQRHLGTTNGIAALRTNIEKGVSIAVAVDPNDTFIGDASIREYHVQAGWGERARELQKEFWDGVMSLAAFRELYQPVFFEKPDRDGWDELWWELKDPSNEDKLSIPISYYKPELYIPLEAGEDTIPTERLVHTASSLVGRIESAAEVRQRERSEKERRLGYLGLMLADLYEEHKDASKRVLEAKVSDSLQQAEKRRQNQLEEAADFLTLPAYEDKIRDEAIHDANATGHDINFGGEVYPAKPENLSDKKVA